MSLANYADRSSPLLASFTMTTRVIFLVQRCPSQPNTIEDCAEHRACDQPNSYTSTSGQYDQDGPAVSPLPENVSQKSFPDPVTNTVRSRTCLQAYLERMARASGYD